MRKLNPRAWIPSLNRYATGFDDLYYHRQMNREGEWWCYPAGEDEPLNVEIELPTGLKDKNGREIYEGDIVRIDSIDELRVGYVELVADQYCIVCGEEDGHKIVAEFYYYSKPEENCEVIGNIHESNMEELCPKE